jgi:hypothetical protein
MCDVACWRCRWFVVIVALASHLGLDSAEEEVLGGPGNMLAGWMQNSDPGSYLGGECVHHPGQKHPERSCLVGIACGPGPQAVCTELGLPMYRGRDRYTQNANTCARIAFFHLPVPFMGSGPQLE